jgi:mannose-6-phosphate isomerase
VTPAVLERWLREKAWPLWLERGVDWKRGSFFEALDLEHHGCHAPFRRLRVAARQIFVFSAAHRAGLAGADRAVALGLGFLERHAAQKEGGYAWRFDLEHRVIDATRDLYDHAFVLLAFASAEGVVAGAGCRERTLALLEWIDAAFAHPAGGYAESVPPALPRRQNPHMHLLEALLAAHEAFGDAVFLERARGIVALFRSRLFDEATGALPEFFGETLEAERSFGRFVVEPGHHYEWAWLLHRYQALAGGSEALGGIVGRLLAVADARLAGGVVNALGSDGSVVDGGFRLWPQTERLRAACVRGGAEREIGEAARVLGAYLRPDGLWHERRHAGGEWSRESAPASSLYHLTGAILAAGAGKPACFLSSSRCPDETAPRAVLRNES